MEQIYDSLYAMPAAEVRAMLGLDDELTDDDVPEHKPRWIVISDYLTSDEYSQMREPFETGITQLDRMLGGGFSGGAYVLMAAPGAGKSAFAVYMALRGALAEQKTAVISLEMPAAQVIWRMASCFAKVHDRDNLMPLTPFHWSDVRRMKIEANKRGDLSTNAFEKAAMMLQMTAGDRLLITEEPWAHEIAGLIDCIREAAQMGCSFIVVDYLQQIKGSGRTDTIFERTSEVMGAIKDVANELDVSVLLIASLNREGATAKAVTMHSGSGGASIEYDAVGVLSLQTVEEESTPERRIVRLTLLKNRNGIAGSSVDLVYRPEFNLFAEKDKVTEE